MKECIIFNPHRGIVWSNGEIFLGDSEDKVQEISVNYEKHGTSYYITSHDLRVDMDENHTIEFIEFSRNQFGRIQASLCNVFVLEQEVSEVLRQLEQYTSIEERENGYMYVLTELDVALWRERTEADVEGFIADMKADGIPVEGNADVEAEWNLAKYFQTVSIGRKGYYA